LLLSKPVGTGILLAGGGHDDKTAAIAVMRRLNRGAAEALSALAPADAPHAVTDVTGFGLLGHAWEMAERSGSTLEVDTSLVPLYAGALAAAEAGVRTGGDARNRVHLEGRVLSTAPPAMEALAYDPQTSGGLVAAVAPSVADDVGLAAAGFVAIGRVVAGPAGVRLL
jgi:selenide,water dikinase